MSAHTCKQLTHGCYRCELNVDEVRAARDEAGEELTGIRTAIRLLTDHERDLQHDVREMSREIDRWDMFKGATS